MEKSNCCNESFIEGTHICSKCKEYCEAIEDEAKRNIAQVETIYRAKKIGRDEWVEGFLVQGIHSYIITADDFSYAVVTIRGGQMSTGCNLIDKSTLAIHFTNSGMNDSEGTPIFASLSSDGNGGDYIEWFPLAYGLKDQKQTDVVGMFQRKIVPLIIRALVFDFSKTKVTGIHTTKEES